jgi:hypothetical protein
MTPQEPSKVSFSQITLRRMPMTFSLTRAFTFPEDKVIFVLFFVNK